MGKIKNENLIKNCTFKVHNLTVKKINSHIKTNLLISTQYWLVLAGGGNAMLLCLDEWFMCCWAAAWWAARVSRAARWSPYIEVGGISIPLGHPSYWNKNKTISSSSQHFIPTQSRENKQTSLVNYYYYVTLGFENHKCLVWEIWWGNLGRDPHSTP